jgi:hypothetical protein
VPALEEAFAEDERDRLRGQRARRHALVSADPAVLAAYRSQEAIAFYLQPIPAGLWEKRSHPSVNARCTHVRARRLDFAGVAHVLLLVVCPL